MLLLTTTSQLLRLITGSAADIDVYVSYVDLNGSTVTPDNQLTPGIVTATTTTICSAPPSGTIRNIKHINITNNSSSASATVDVEIFDGTNPTELRAVTLLPGENLAMDETAQWHHRDAQNGDYTYTPPSNQNLGVTGTIAETIPRELCPETNSTVGPSGQLYMMAIQLRAGDLVSTIDLWSATTAANTPTNYNVGLYDVNRNLLAQGTNKTTEAWAANSLKSFAMVTPYRVPVTGLYYIGFYMVATAVVTLKGGAARTGAQLSFAAPVISGLSSTGLTTALPNPAAVLSITTSSIYAAVR